jgi:nucleoside-diphosphate-sugar epimerase
MRMLMLGGTSFIGRHIAVRAIEDGHTLTFFNRGTTNASLFADQEHVRGDRYTDLERLGDRTFDAVVDTSGFTPDSVRDAALALAPRTERYVFISSIDVYDLSETGITESSATRELAPDAQTSVRDPELYGAHKARCERILADVLGPERLLVARPGLVVGPYDYTDRFTYWPVRIARGGEVLAPRDASMPVQVIDVRDLAAWIVRAVNDGLSGAYNLTGTPAALTFGDVVDTSKRASGSAPAITWADEAFLLEHEVGPWFELPLWPPPDPKIRGLLTVSNERARATGLTLRPLAETAEAVLHEYRARTDPALKAGLSPEREAALLAAWHGR